MLRETVKAFSLTNEELAEEKTGHQDYEECKLACRVSKGNGRQLGYIDHLQKW